MALGTVLGRVLGMALGMVLGRVLCWVGYCAGYGAGYGVGYGAGHGVAYVLGRGDYLEASRQAGVAVGIGSGRMKMNVWRVGEITPTSLRMAI
jgi:hypothetical protein